MGAYSFGEITEHSLFDCVLQVAYPLLCLVIDLEELFKARETREKRELVSQSIQKLQQKLYLASCETLSLALNSENCVGYH